MLDRFTNVIVVFVIGAAAITVAANVYDAWATPPPWISMTELRDAMMFGSLPLPLLVLPLCLNYVRHGRLTLWNRVSVKASS